MGSFSRASLDVVNQDLSVLVVLAVVSCLLQPPGIPPPSAVPSERGSSVPRVSRGQAGASWTLRSGVGASQRGGRGLSSSPPSSSITAPAVPLLLPPGLNTSLDWRVGSPGSRHLLVKGPELLGEGAVHVEPPVTDEILLVEQSSCGQTRTIAGG